MDPILIPPRPVERVWGALNLEPWFSRTNLRIDHDRPIGEVWFEGAQTPILVKFLFTTEDLSIQVHPGDEYAGIHHNSPGKTEMWHVLRAQPGARVALGLHQELTREQLQEAALSGDILKLMNWIPVKAGDTLFAPAGEIHAIGAGLAVCEIQQISDITYRLYDYGRGRELHLSHGLEVSNLKPFQPAPQPNGVLARCQYFQTDLITATSSFELVSPSPEKPWLLICTQGAGRIGDNLEYSLGQVWEVPAGMSAVTLTPAEPSRFVRTFQP